MIFGADNYCLMEARTLFDRAGVSTESSLIDNSEGVEPVRQCIQRNLAYVDLLVFDLRHLDIDLGNVLDREMSTAARIILLHYDQIIELPPILQQAEFFSVINTSRKISQLLAKETPPTSAIDDLETQAETSIARKFYWSTTTR